MSEKKIEWYHDFINLKHNPKKDLNVLFYFEPAKGITKEDAVGRIASESSAGTWTTLAYRPKLLPKTKAYAYEYDKNFTKIAYPQIIFEEGSISAMMSGFGGNVFGMKAVKNLKLLDAEFPKEILKYYEGPVYGKDVISKIFKRKTGPITSVVPKPKLAATAREHAEKYGMPVWLGGIDCIKDDENLTNQSFNRFDERVKLLAKYRDKAEKITGEIKEAFINVTAPNLKELEKRVKTISEQNFKYFMLDVVVSGFTAVQTATQLARDYKMAIHGHRAMHGMFTRNPKHGMSMLFLAKLMRMAGIDQFHIGTVIGKLEGKKEEIMAIKDMITSSEVDEIKKLRMKQKWYNIKPMLPVASGGLHPGILPDVLNIYGTTDLVLQIGGGTLGHPKGIEAGAKAVMQSIEAYKQKINLNEYAENHRELKEALQKWGRLKPQ
ncbi:type III ribulose-bisphosphate carboxylase [Candidatus Pacearchaeota archaeon]|nr:type III ribulose-bisphosphate carboxylase [Candidatus Pacearchaeota archaeon]